MGILGSLLKQEPKLRGKLVTHPQGLRVTEAFLGTKQPNPTGSGWDLGTQFPQALLNLQAKNIQCIQGVGF